MKVVVKEAGYLLAYSFSELEKNKEVYPIFCEISDDGIKRTKEFHNQSLADAVREAIEAIEDSNKPLIGSFIIIPVEVRSRKNAKLETALMSIIKKDGIIIKILQKYYYDDNILKLKPYKVIEAENISDDELEVLQKYYESGILSYNEGKNVWINSFKDSEYEIF